MSYPPLVSIIMCTYNGEKYLDEQIDSILKQDYTAIELIIVDDRSTDNTWQKLNQWKELYPSISTCRNEINLGYNKNFENALSLANGDFIALADQDDIWLPQKITELINSFTSDKIVLSHCRSVSFENGKKKYKKMKLHYHFRGNDSRKLFFFNQIMGHDCMFRKSLLIHIPPIPPGVMYDWWIAVVATCYGQIESVDKFLVYHRVHETNSFFKRTQAVKKNEPDMDETWKYFLGIPGLSEKSRFFLKQLLMLMEKHHSLKPGSLDMLLFRFLFKNRKIIFGHKKRTVPVFSYLKNSIKYAKLTYKGRGIV